MADDPALIAWLDSAGLSVAEAARIQPAYNGGFPISRETNRVTGDFALTAIALGSVSLATSAVNVVEPGDRRLRRRAMVLTPDVIFAQSAPRLGLLVHTNF